MVDLPPHLMEGKCEYCLEEVDKDLWCSKWCEREHEHYKILKCPHCKKDNWLNVDFHGSGHDPVLKKEESELESVVRKVQEGD